MKLKETSVSVWIGLRNPVGKNEFLLREFLDSGQTIMEVEGWENNYTDVYSCVATLQAAARKAHLGVRASARKGRAFLINTVLYEEEKK